MTWLRAATPRHDMQCADSARATMGWPGFVLPPVRMSNGPIHPVVTWTDTAEARWTDGPPPTSRRATLAEWETDGPPTAINIIGFMHIGSPTAGVDRLKAVAAYGSGALVVANLPRTAWTMAEADMAGLSVVEVRPDGRSHMALAGRNGPVASARRTVATRLREEQLFEWALRAGHRPADELVSVLVS